MQNMNSARQSLDVIPSGCEEFFYIPRFLPEFIPTTEFTLSVANVLRTGSERSEGVEMTSVPALPATVL